ncbi:MAG: hypothetical protein ISF22_11240 [Methanomassiliicoccus sp.]|nr:hypothetical protein [Methanomassiliicoccus sp.]
MEVIKHTAESCPVYNSKYREMTVNWMEKVEPTAARYGVKFMGSWTDHPTHVVYAMFDTPSLDNMMKFTMDPEMGAPLSFCSVRMFPVMEHQQTLGMLKQEAH